MSDKQFVIIFQDKPVTSIFNGFQPLRFDSIHLAREYINAIVRKGEVSITEFQIYPWSYYKEHLKEKIK